MFDSVSISVPISFYFNLYLYLHLYLYLYLYLHLYIYIYANRILTSISISISSSTSSNRISIVTTDPNQALRRGKAPLRWSQPFHHSFHSALAECLEGMGGARGWGDG